MAASALLQTSRCAVCAAAADASMIVRKALSLHLLLLQLTLLLLLLLLLLLWCSPRRQ
jgi:hypothetical protein